MVADDFKAKEALVLEALRNDHHVPASQLSWCTSSTLQRYLRARKGVVRDAAKLLHSTLRWREATKVDSVSKDNDFTKDIAACKMYVGGNDDEGRSVLVTRKKADRLAGNEHESYVKYLTFTLETAVKAMQNGQEKWVWIMDLAGYSRANSPPLSVSMQTLHILADHYPERLEKCYMVDAPSIFWVLFQALSPFIDPETKRKIVFVNSANIDSLEKAGTMPAAHARIYRQACDVDKYRSWLAQLWDGPAAAAPAAAAPAAATPAPAAAPTGNPSPAPVPAAE